MNNKIKTNASIEEKSGSSSSSGRFPEYGEKINKSPPDYLL